MSIIHNDDGDLDIETAQAVIADIGNRTNEAIAKRDLAKIQAAALVDIAGSLRTLALESAFAMSAAGFALGGTDKPDDEPAPDDNRDELKHAEPGTRVRALVVDAAGAVPYGTLTDEGGIDQDEAWRGVKWDDEERITRVFVRAIEPAPVTIDELADSGVPLAGVATEAEAAALRTDGDEDGEEAAGGYELDEPANTVAEPDDLDDDFEGDEHPAADDAVAALKAREAARKKSKKGKGK